MRHFVTGVSNCEMEKYESKLDKAFALRRETPLSPEEAYELLENDDIATRAVQPVLPKAGEVYLFMPDEEAKAGKLYATYTPVKPYIKEIYRLINLISDCHTMVRMISGYLLGGYLDITREKNHKNKSYI